MNGRVRKGMLFLPLVLLLWTSPVRGQSCVTCHDGKNFQGEVVHGPVRTGKCTSCHAPHASRNKGLLKEPAPDLCLGCHPALKKRLAEKGAIHEPLRKGNCDACHAPHVSGHRGLLQARGAESCFLCHKDLKRDDAVRHPPFARGECDACHDPHGGEDSRLLKETVPKLCLGCHPETASLRRRHLDRDLGKMDCLACHHPHGSAGGPLLRAVRHPPFAEGNCRTCHGSGKGADCLSCHEGVRETFYGLRSHMGDGRSCRACHNPHAGDGPGMLPKDQSRLCRSCHGDTFARRQGMLYRHPRWTACTTCHDLHASDRLAMLREEPDRLCGSCHDNHSTFTHPIGENAPDPRTGQPMSCITCHDANTGTLFQYLLRGGRERGLCIQCHTDY